MNNDPAAANKVPLVNSIAFRSMVVFTVALLLIIGVGGSFLIYRQSKLVKIQTFEANEAGLSQASFIVKSQFDLFKNRLILLAATPYITDQDSIEAGRFLKGYNVSPLFIPGEYVVLYNAKHEKVSDNSMVGLAKIAEPHRELEDFKAVVPQRPYISPLFWEQSTPKKIIAVAVENRATSNGFLSASFSFRRIWELFENYKVGNHGFFVIFDESGAILYHPDIRKWVNQSHKADDLGLHNFDAKSYQITQSTYIRLNDGKAYLANYKYNATEKIGIMSLQPRDEVEAMMWSMGSGFVLIALCILLVILFVSFWLFHRVGRPLQTLIDRMLVIVKGNYNESSGITGKKNDEIHVLAQVFDKMRLTIKDKIMELAEHKAHLEMEIIERTQDLAKANSQLEIISRTDELTGLPNRRDIREKISYEIYRAERSKKAFSFVFIDIDKFKDFNDTYGHVCGDLVLQTVSRVMRQQLRKQDIVARWGGEEFLTMLPETDLAGALQVAERFRKKIEETEISFSNCKIHVTITLGVSLYDARLGMDRSIDLADRALYKGKQSGRNKVVEFNPNDITAEDLQAAEMEKKYNEATLASANEIKQKPLDVKYTVDTKTLQKSIAPKKKSHPNQSDATESPNN
ncbi:MAG: diguanylate cyclase [Fibrobacteraceae bacterium]|nr:diguanylate cyclase [Fibrobacteraceae bacterium]